ncbi:WD40 repeat-like protein [Xylariaceae sp. FL0016]|nr:WD40 repeat-like protein [Xylariaceae sp. FL0016]
MEPFTTTQIPDEGYSEHPLNTSGPSDLDDNSAAIALRSSDNLPAWLHAQLPNLSIQEKKRLAMVILNQLPTTIIADIVMTELNPRLYIDFVDYLPPEICLKVLGYLDSVSLIHIAMCCRGWHQLALDRKLWEKLYYMEGWKALPAEIVAAERRMNEGLASTQIHHQKVQSVEDGHAHKKRAVLDPAPSDDDDFDMVDSESSAREEPKDIDMSGTSLFGGTLFGGAAKPAGSGSSQQSNSSVVQHMSNLIMNSPSPMPDLKGKGVARTDKGKGKVSNDPTDTAMLQADIAPNASNLPKSSLWSFHPRDRKYQINWKYLYTMRRRLEKNWEDGRHVNFQLPHPDHPEEGHNECIYSLQYNSEYLVSGSRDRTLRVWNLRTRRLARPPLTGHSGSVLCLQFDSDPDEDLIVSGSSDSDVILWKFSTGEIIQRLQTAHRESVLNVKFDKRILVTCSKDKSIKIFNRQPLRPGEMGYGDINGVSPVPINLRKYGYDDSPLNQLPIKPPYTMIGCLEGHGAAVNAVQICDDEIVSASGDRHIKLWEWPTGHLKRTFIGHAKGIACVQYDGRRIVSGSSDNEVKVFDRATGLEVASLRSHSNLVRTVQAGFGDLPYSQEEDQLEARAVDQAYFRALNTGTLQEPGAGSGRIRPHNAGSRRPEDITAYGAKLPPGGGGGSYARIVSGSYDQKIIIWRRDRKGLWYSQHTLRQEEGAAAAHRQRTANSTMPPRPAPVPGDAGNASNNSLASPSGAQPPPPPASAPPALQRPPPVYAQVEHPIHATITAQTTASYTQMIDTCVPQGPAALQQALTAYPTMLTYHSDIQSAIDREPNAMTRSQLRQVVSTALVRAQLAQNRIRESVQAALSAESEVPSPQPIRSGSRVITTRPGHSLSSPSGPHLNNAGAPGASTSRTSVSQNAGNGGGPPSLPQSTHQIQPALTQRETLSQSQVAEAQAQTIPLPSQVQGPQPPHPQSHPHIAQADTSPARIFKLQFDARRIICCSQISTIVGWDFCNGDPDLEEVSRFFATVD